MTPLNQIRKRNAKSFYYVIFCAFFAILLKDVISKYEKAEFSDAQKKKILDAHQRCRDEFGMKERLVWIDEPYQNLKTRTLKDDIGPHEGKLGDFGENMYGGGSPGGAESLDQQTELIVDGIHAWCNEKLSYTIFQVAGTLLGPPFKLPGKMGHLTQIISAQSTGVSCAAGSGKRMNKVLCGYSPPGNHAMPYFLDMKLKSHIDISGVPNERLGNKETLEKLLQDITELTKGQTWLKQDSYIEVFKKHSSQSKAEKTTPTKEIGKIGSGDNKKKDDLAKGGEKPKIASQDLVPKNSNLFKESTLFRSNPAPTVVDKAAEKKEIKPAVTSNLGGKPEKEPENVDITTNTDNKDKMDVQNKFSDNQIKVESNTAPKKGFQNLPKKENNSCKKPKAGSVKQKKQDNQENNGPKL